MRYGKRMYLTAAFLVIPAMVWAGNIAPAAPAPALGDFGLIALGVGLAGTGLAALRRR